MLFRSGDIRQAAGIDVFLRDRVGRGTCRDLRRSAARRLIDGRAVASDRTTLTVHLVIDHREIVNVHRPDVCDRVGVGDHIADIGVVRRRGRLLEFVPWCNRAQVFIAQAVAAAKIPIVVVRIVIEDLRAGLSGGQQTVQQDRIGRREPSRIECVVPETGGETLTDGPGVVCSFGRQTRPTANVHTVQDQADVVFIKTTGLRVAIKSRKPDVDLSDGTAEIVCTAADSAIQRDRIVDRKGVAAKPPRLTIRVKAAKCAVGIAELVVNLAVDALHNDDDTACFGKIGRAHV